MQLTDHVYLVGGGPFSGFGITSQADSHTYLIDGGDDLALIDCGLGVRSGFDELVANITADGFDPSRISTVAITHFHADHAGGAALARSTFDATIAVDAVAAAAIEAGDEEATGLRAAREAGVFPADTVLQPCPVDVPLTQGDVVRIGRATLEFIATPGHCTGHGAYLLSGLGEPALFAGDAVFWAGRILLQAVPDCDLQQSLASIERLAELEFESFLPGHGPITVSGGSIHPAMALAEIQGLGVPKGIL